MEKPGGISRCFPFMFVSPMVFGFLFFSSPTLVGSLASRQTRTDRYIHTCPHRQGPVGGARHRIPDICPFLAGWKLEREWKAVREVVRSGRKRREAAVRARE